MNANEVARTAWVYRPRLTYTEGGKEYMGRDHNRDCPSCNNTVTDEIRDSMEAYNTFYKEKKYHVMHCQFCNATWSYSTPN